MATRAEHPGQPAPGTAVGAWSRLWLLALGLAVTVVAAITAMKAGSVPASSAAKLALGVTITLLFATSLAAVGRGGRSVRSHPRASADDPPSDEDEVRGSPEIERVHAWRHARLAALGVPGERALLLAVDTRFSIHELERLLGDGCPLATALRILQPA